MGLTVCFTSSPYQTAFLKSNLCLIVNLLEEKNNRKEINNASDQFGYTATEIIYVPDIMTKFDSGERFLPTLESCLYFAISFSLKENHANF